MAVPHAAALGQHIFEPAQLKRSWYQYFFQMPLSDAVVPMNDYAVIDTLWRDWSPGYEPDPGVHARAEVDVRPAPGSPAAPRSTTTGSRSARRRPIPRSRRCRRRSSQPTPVPTLYLHGTDDGVMGTEIVVEDELRPFFPAGLELVMVPGTGHFLHLEEPDVVNHRIVTFLQG